MIRPTDNDYTEDALVEQPVIELFASLGGLFRRSFSEDGLNSKTPHSQIPHLKIPDS
jgi:hypothetical protein